MIKSDAGIHERINMINSDLIDAFTQIEGCDEDIGRLAEANKLQSASIGAVNQRVKSVEFVTDRILKQLEEQKQTRSAPAAKKVEKPTEEEEMHEVFAEEEDSAPEGMTYLGYYELTAYEATGNACANGNMPTVGYTVACNSLALGTRIYIEGYGEYVVEDRGGMAGNVIDIYLGDPDACIQFGRQGANVYVIN